jgi:hypothetical protein
MKTILVTPNLSGDGNTAFTRDLSAALSALKPAPSVAALDFAGGELWRQSKRQNAFTAYPSEAFNAAWKLYVNRARQTMPEDDLTVDQREQLARSIKNGLDLVVMDSSSPAAAANVDMVLLTARCDPRNLATLRQKYQTLKEQNASTYVVLLQGSDEGRTGLVTTALQQKLVEKGVKSIRANGSPLYIPRHDDAYSLAAHEGAPIFRLTDETVLEPDDRNRLRRVHHDAASEVQRLLRVADVTAKRRETVAV